MNKNLAIFVDQEYLIAGAEPYKGKFHYFSKTGNSQFPFYFFIDPVNHKIDYSLVYKADFEKGDENIIGDFIDLICDKSNTYTWYDYTTPIIHLLTPILNDIKQEYFSVMNTFSEKKVDQQSAIPLKIAFSDTISSQARQELLDFLKKNNITIKSQEKNLPELIVGYYLEKEQLNLVNKDFALIEALGENLNMSVVHVNDDNEIKRSHFKIFPGRGNDPRVRVIAKKIVEDIDRQEGLFPNSQAREKEIEQQYKIAEQILQKHEKYPKPYQMVTTSFSILPQRLLSVTLSMQEIEQMAGFEVKQITQFFVTHFLEEVKLEADNFEKIILIGNTLDNNLVKREFFRFGSHNLINITNSELSIVLQALLSEVSPASSKPRGHAAPANDYKNMEYLTLDSLAPGQMVKLLNYDSAPGKGDSMQELKYQGENCFTVVQSTRSLMRGDILTASSVVWAPGMQLEFIVQRGQKELGRFLTREVVNISVR